MSFLDRWHRVPRPWRKLTATVSTLAGVAAIYTMANVLFDATIRPAWAWEVDELSQEQLETSLDLERINRRDAVRELAEYKSMRQEFIRDGEPIPSWLVSVIADIELDIREIDEDINSIQEKLVAED